MKKFYVLQRNFDIAKPSKQFELETIQAHSKEAGWEEVECSIMNTCSQAWIMTPAEFKALKQVIKEV